MAGRLTGWEPDRAIVTFCPCPKPHLHCVRTILQFGLQLAYHAQATPPPPPSVNELFHNKIVSYFYLDVQWGPKILNCLVLYFIDIYLRSCHRYDAIPIFFFFEKLRIIIMPSLTASIEIYSKCYLEYFTLICELRRETLWCNSSEAFIRGPLIMDLMDYSVYFLPHPPTHRDRS